MDRTFLVLLIESGDSALLKHVLYIYIIWWSPKCGLKSFHRELGVTVNFGMNINLKFKYLQNYESEGW